MPTLEHLHRRLGPNGVVVLAVSQDERPEAVPPWIAERGFTFPVLLDPYAELGHALGVSGYPETFIVDRQGTIVHHHIGYRDWAAADVVAALERLLDTGQWVLAASTTRQVNAR
jgi:peroxiredoxin